MCSETLCVCIHIECGSFSSLNTAVQKAQYYLLKEMTETVPRVKRITIAKKKKKRLEK